MGKKVKAAKPFIYNKYNSNFKLPLFEEWLKAGKEGVTSRQWKGLIKKILFHTDFPSFNTLSGDARLCFVEGASVVFDSFPDSLFHEVIPVFWDCWPQYFEKVALWLEKHNVNTAIFTSSQTANRIKEYFPQKNILTITEGIETSLYKEGPSLIERDIDFFEFGRCSKAIDSRRFSNNIRVLSSKYHWKSSLQTRKQLIEAMSNSKITIALTRQDTQPDIAQGIDTLTQRYWECMLSRIVMVGRAPKELIELIGYNPVIPIDKKDTIGQIEEILTHIQDFQSLADKNRAVALEKGDWSIRAKDIITYLERKGYET